jgi:hypothetical protein
MVMAPALLTLQATSADREFDLHLWPEALDALVRKPLSHLEADRPVRLTIRSRKGGKNVRHGRRGRSQRDPCFDPAICISGCSKCGERASEQGQRAWKIGGWRTGQGVQHMAGDGIFGHSRKQAVAGRIDNWARRLEELILTHQVVCDVEDSFNRQLQLVKCGDQGFYPI